jgi:hypothetical protein
VRLGPLMAHSPWIQSLLQMGARPLSVLSNDLFFFFANHEISSYYVCLCMSQVQGNMKRVGREVEKFFNYFNGDG